jgi:hypothetical protein
MWPLLPLRLDAYRCRQPNDPMAPVLFEIMPGTLYLTVVSRLISIVLDTSYGTRAVGAMLVRVTPSTLL